MTPIGRLAERGIELPEPLQPKGSYVPLRIHGDTAWASGCTARSAGSAALAGVVGAGVTLEQACAETERATINLLAALQAHVGLDRVAAVLHLRGYVRADPEFTQHPAVVDAASNLLAHTFGPQVGAHARTALGVASLPGGACVELDAVVALHPASG